MELRLGRNCFTRFVNKCPFVHIGNTNSADMRRSAREAVLHKIHKHFVETSRLVMRIPWNTGEITPFVRALAQNTILTAWRGRPIQDGRVLCDEFGDLRLSLEAL